jgi:transketolase
VTPGVLFVYTHDSIGVGEDGPTHEPVEHLMSLRAMPNLHVVRPSDANEALDLIEEYLSAKEPPTTAMILSRQDMPVFNDADHANSVAGERATRWLRRARARRRGLHVGGHRI